MILFYIFRPDQINKNKKIKHRQTDTKKDIVRYTLSHSVCFYVTLSHTDEQNPCSLIRMMTHDSSLMSYQ